MTLSIGLTYIAATEGHGVVKNSRRFLVNSFIDWLRRRWIPKREAGGISVGWVNWRLNASLLFDIVGERKRSAGGVCPSGSAG